LAKKKKKIERPKHKPTRRQLSRWQKQKRRQRFIIGIGVSVILIAIGLVTAGVYYQWYVPQQKPLKETVIEVNDTSFNMAYYIDTLKYRLTGISPQMVMYYLDIVVQGIQQNELVRQEALELGITVSDAEVDEEINSEGLQDSQAVRDITRAKLLFQKMKEDYFNEKVPVSAEQRHVMAMFLESEKQTNSVRQRLLAGEDFSQLAVELSLDTYTRESNGDLGWKPEGIINDLLTTSVLEEYVFSYSVGDVVIPVYDAKKTKQLGYWLVEVLERNAETGEAHVQAMMLGSEEEAQMILSKLSEGQEFTDLAQEYSQSWADEEGADLGWITKGDVSDTIGGFVFNLETELNSISTPIPDEGVSTEGGYWLFKIPEEGVREISEEDRDLLIEQAMQDWLDSLFEDPENIVNSYLDDEMREFAIDRFS